MTLSMTLSIGDTAPEFTLPRAGGGEVSLTPATAAATVVVWTCNHCPYALAWHERLQAVARDYASRGVRFLQVNPNDATRYPADSLAMMVQRVTAGEFASDYLRDEDQSVSRAWGAIATPDVFVLDGAGRLAYRGAPDANYEDESLAAGYLRDALDDLLAGRAVARPETTPKGCSIKWLSPA